MQNELSTKFWESIEKLECLSLDDVADIIEENKQRWLCRIKEHTLTSMVIAM